MRKIILILITFIYIGECHGSKEGNLNKLCDIADTKNVEIIYHPFYITTNIAINKERLKREYIYKFEINNIQDTPYQKEIVKMLGVSYFEHEKTNDLRWGVMMTSHKGKECSLFFDYFGDCGQINNLKVCFKKNTILEWIQKKIPFITQDYLLGDNSNPLNVE